MIFIHFILNVSERAERNEYLKLAPTKLTVNLVIFIHFILSVSERAERNE